MMNIKNSKLITYWIDSAEKDYKAMTHLFEKGDYSWCLFIGHLVLEKLLKAWYVKNISDTPPFIHDLLRLAENGKMPLTEDQKDIFDTVTTFNIRAR
jgi:HEPN domain-containing protein